MASKQQERQQVEETAADGKPRETNKNCNPMRRSERQKKKLKLMQNGTNKCNQNNANGYSLKRLTRFRHRNCNQTHELFYDTPKRESAVFKPKLQPVTLPKTTADYAPMSIRGEATGPVEAALGNGTRLTLRPAKWSLTTGHANRCTHNVVRRT